MRLLIVRHGVAEDRKEWEAEGRDDALRPLTDAGREKMRAAVRGLVTVVTHIDVLAASPLTRAAQTAALVAECYRGLATTTVDELVPDARGTEFLRWLRDLQGTGAPAKVVAAVGHEPHLGHLASWLLTGREDPFISLKKGGALLLDFGDFLQAGLPRLVWALPPKLLRALGEPR